MYLLLYICDSDIEMLTKQRRAGGPFEENRDDRGSQET